MTLEPQTNPIITLENENVVQSYKRPPFVLERGDGVVVYDTDGKAYLDWVAGIAVNALGYNDVGLQNAIQSAGGGLLHTSNLYYTAPQAELASALVENSFAERVFFSNSGAEANEGAIKFARKAAIAKGNPHKTEIVSFTHAFHGRTMGALALTPKEKYQQPFKPLMAGAVLGEFNSIESARAVIGENTAAVFVEPIQGEGGIHAAMPEFLQTLRELCDQFDAALIFDEIQCGLGRTGKLWAHQHSGVTPDIMTLAKPLAGGLPIGAILTTNAIAQHIQPGDHGTTFGGGPFITSVAKYVFDRINQPQFLEHVSEVGTYLKERLSEINSPLIKDVRGEGLMVGLELTVDVAPFIEKGYEAGLLMVNAGTDVIRFVPPLVIEKSHVDVLIEKLTAMLASVE